MPTPERCILSALLKNFVTRNPIFLGFCVHPPNLRDSIAKMSLGNKPEQCPRKMSSRSPEIRDLDERLPVFKRFMKLLSQEQRTIFKIVQRERIKKCHPKTKQNFLKVSVGECRVRRSKVEKPVRFQT